MKRMPLRVAVLALLATLVPGLGACELGTGGVSGNLQFRDRTQTVPIDLVGHVDQPVAVGAALALGVTVGSTSQDADLVAATSSDSGVLEVESFSAGRVVVRGVAPGRAFLDVTARDGLEDSLAVAVAAIDETEIVLLPWDPIVQLPDSLWLDGVVILPDSLVDLFARHRNAEGTILTGYGAANWEVSEGAEATLSPEAGTDFATLHSGQTPEAFEVSTTAGASLTLETVEETAVARLALFVQGTSTAPVGDGGTLTLPGDSSYLFHVAAYTTDDHYVVGAGEDAITVEVPEADAAVFHVANAPDGSGEELDRVLANGRAFLAQAGLAGVSEVTVRWAGLSLTVDLLITTPQQ